MNWRPQMLLRGLLLFATLITVAIKTLTPPSRARGALAQQLVDLPAATAKHASVKSSHLSTETKARTYPGLVTLFEFESSWDKGAFWDDLAPAFDLSRPRAALSQPSLYDEFEAWGEPAGTALRCRSTMLDGEVIVQDKARCDRF